MPNPVRPLRASFGNTSRRLAAALALASMLSGCGGMTGLTDSLSDSWSLGSKPAAADNALSATPAKSDGKALAPDMAEADDSQPIADLYNKGLAKLNEGQYNTAVKNFAEVEKQHPYSIWATRAILMQAYAQYMRNAYDESINAAQRFNTLHPGHKDGAYAYYLLALCYYEQIGDVRRDQSGTQRALNALDDVSRRFPDSPYARDAAAKAILARDHLAGKEMEVGRYYQQRNNQVGAINRYKVVVTEYQTTAHVEEALYRLAETNMVLGIVPEAQTAAAVLGHNYPNSDWYKDAYALLSGQGLQPVNNPESWISQAVRQVNPFSG
jgi:outer membrane protein assembly factor BamD